jgi:hypothetical protein
MDQHPIDLWFSVGSLYTYRLGDAIRWHRAGVAASGR